MDPATMIALTAASAALVAIPGPNVALIVANTLAHGVRLGVATVLGTTVGAGLQLATVVLGLAALIEHAAAAFVWLRWAGVAYLLLLGIRAWRQGAADAAAPESDPRAARRVLRQGVLLAAVNPKTLVFNAAFLPQFVDPAAGGAGLWTAAAIYLGVLLVGDLAWVASAGWARPAVLRLGRLRHRLSGTLYLGSGLGLALARIDR